jgi:predicted AAA+ superfamily ATPase
MLLVHEQAFWQRDTGHERVQLAVIERAAPLPHAVIVSGLPRVGKSTLLAQFPHHPGQAPFDYINFEEDRFLGFQADEANHLYAVLLELFGERKMDARPVLVERIKPSQKPAVPTSALNRMACGRF